MGTGSRDQNPQSNKLDVMVSKSSYHKVYSQSQGLKFGVRGEMTKWGIKPVRTIKDCTMESKQNVAYIHMMEDYLAMKRNRELTDAAI